MKTEQEIKDYFEKIQTEINDIMMLSSKFEQDIIDDENTPLELKETLKLLQRRRILSSEIDKIDDVLYERANKGKKIVGYNSETFKPIYEN